MLSNLYQGNTLNEMSKKIPIEKDNPQPPELVHK